MITPYRLLAKNGYFLLLDFARPRNFIVRLGLNLWFKIAEPYGKSFLEQDLVKNLTAQNFNAIKENRFYFGIFRVVKAKK